MQLRYLSTLATIGNEKNSTIVFPFPVELTQLLGKLDLGDGRPRPAPGDPQGS